MPSFVCMDAFNYHLHNREGMGIVDLNADERNSLPTVRTEDGNVFEIVCRKAAGKEDGWMSAN